MRLLVCTQDLEVCPPESIATVSIADAIDPALFGVTPAGMAQVFGMGVGLVLFFWALGFGIGLAVGLIKKA